MYTLRKRNDTEEVHIFLADPRPDGKCASRQNSICRKAPRAETTVTKACLTEQEARLASAKIGRKVCGTCVSHLYETY
ncbi:hypothetical protein DK254_02965 [Pseudomonas sp. RW407]|nr:hypothetical protein DK254_02965 [Pseudomonas sp. RW407]